MFQTIKAIENLPLIAGLVGHRVRSIMGRYANALASALLTAADRVAMRISETLEGRERGATIISIGGVSAEGLTALSHPSAARAHQV